MVSSRLPLSAMLVLTASSLTTFVHAQSSQSLTQKEAVAMAIKSHPLLEGSVQKLNGARARLKGAGLLQNPVLSLAQPFGQSTGGLDEGILLTQTIELGEKRRLRISGARAEFGAIEAERLAMISDITFAVVTLYNEILRAEAELNLAQTAVDNASTFLKSAEIQFKVGDVARSNVLRGKIELTRAEQTLQSTETELKNRRSELQSLLGLHSETALTEKLSFNPSIYSLVELQRKALDHRGDISSAFSTLKARMSVYQGTRSLLQPDLFLELRHSVLDPTTGGTTLRLGITFPLFDYGRVRHEAQSAGASVKEQETAIRELKRTVLLEVQTAYQNWVQSKRAVEAFNAGRLVQAKELLDIMQSGYEKHANSYLELIDAQQLYRSENVEYIRALAAYNIAEATLLHASGGLVK